MMSCAARDAPPPRRRDNSLPSSAHVSVQLIEELLRIASDDDSHAAIVAHALQSSGALACTCSSDHARSIVQLVVHRLPLSSIDSDLSVCFLHAAALVIRRFVDCILSIKLNAHSLAATTVALTPSPLFCSA